MRCENGMRFGMINKRQMNVNSPCPGFFGKEIYNFVRKRDNIEIDE